MDVIMKIFVVNLLILFFLSSCVSIPLTSNEKDCGPGSDKKTYCIDKIFK